MATTPARVAKHPIHPMLVVLPLGLWIAALNRGQALTLGIAKGDQGSPRFWFTLGAPF